jgi:hypothetical protein
MCEMRPGLRFTKLAKGIPPSTPFQEPLLTLYLNLQIIGCSYSPSLRVGIVARLRTLRTRLGALCELYARIVAQLAAHDDLHLRLILADMSV